MSSLASPPPPAGSPDVTQAATAASIAQCLNAVIAAGNLTDLPVDSLASFLDARAGSLPTIAQASMNVSAAGAAGAAFAERRCPVTDGRPVSLTALVQAAQADAEQTDRGFPELSLSIGVRLIASACPMGPCASWPAALAALAALCWRLRADAVHCAST